MFQSLIIINLNLDSVKRPPLELEPHFGNRCLHRQLRDFTDTQGENINRMSPLLSGMFPLRIYACHQRTSNVSRWACRTLWYGRFPIIWSLIVDFWTRGEIECRTTLRKKQPCSQGKDSPPSLLPPPSSLFLTVWFDWCRGCATSGSMRKGSSIQSQFILFKWKNQ